MSYNCTCIKCGTKFEAIARLHECLECYEIRMGWKQMGAYKALVIDIADTMYQISRDLNDASESGDFDVMKQALRNAIVNSALTIAHIEELER